MLIKTLRDKFRPVESHLRPFLRALKFIEDQTLRLEELRQKRASTVEKFFKTIKNPSEDFIFAIDPFHALICEEKSYNIVEIENDLGIQDYFLRTLTPEQEGLFALWKVEQKDVRDLEEEIIEKSETMSYYKNLILRKSEDNTHYHCLGNILRISGKIIVVNKIQS